MVNSGRRHSLVGMKVVVVCMKISRNHQQNVIDSAKPWITYCSSVCNNLYSSHALYLCVSNVAPFFLRKHNMSSFFLVLNRPPPRVCCLTDISSPPQLCLLNSSSSRELPSLLILLQQFLLLLLSFAFWRLWRAPSPSAPSH